MFLHEIVFLAVLNFFLVQKLIFEHFWNCNKWNLPKKISWNWFIWFHEFFWPWLFQFSGPQCVCSLFTFFVFILAIAIVETMVTMRKMTKKMMRNMIQCLAWTQIVSHLPNFCLGVFPRSVPDFQAMSTLRQIFVPANLLCEPFLPNLQYRFVFLHFWWFFQSGAHTDVPSTHCSLLSLHSRPEKTHEIK